MLQIFHVYSAEASTHMSSGRTAEVSVRRLPPASRAQITGAQSTSMSRHSFRRLNQRTLTHHLTDYRLQRRHQRHQQHKPTVTFSVSPPPSLPPTPPPPPVHVCTKGLHSGAEESALNSSEAPEKTNSHSLPPYNRFVSTQATDLKLRSNSY